MHFAPLPSPNRIKKKIVNRPEIFMVVFSHEKGENSVKKNLMIVEKISRFIRGLTAENTNS